MSEKKAAKPAPKVKVKVKKPPHKTVKKVVQQVGKAPEKVKAAESVQDLKAGRKVAEKAGNGSGTSIKDRLLPKLLKEFEADRLAGSRRPVKDIAEAVSFESKQVVKYATVYEKEAYTFWKTLPKAGAEKPAPKVKTAKLKVEKPEESAEESTASED